MLGVLQRRIHFRAVYNFVFFKQKTAYEMRISDWSSDVCSSDLLADLKVQASTYGQQIPQLFGAMRVAGSVIWATDLIERRSKRGGGKGRPSTTEYSYAVSLAVALSSRARKSVV